MCFRIHIVCGTLLITIQEFIALEIILLRRGSQTLTTALLVYNYLCLISICSRNVLNAGEGLSPSFVNMFTSDSSVRSSDKLFSSIVTNPIRRRISSIFSSSFSMYLKVKSVRILTKNFVAWNFNFSL